MEKKEQIVCKILNYGANAEGVAKLFDGKVAFIPFTLKNEEVVARVKTVKKDFVNLMLTEVNKQSKFRVEPKCKYYGKCGGCQLQHVEYSEGLKIKQEIVQNALLKIGKLNVNVLPIIESNLTYGYRNKVSLPFDYNTRSLAMHDIDNKLIPVNDCVIVENWCKKLIQITNEYVKQNGVSVYNPETNKGLLKQLIARKVSASLLITLVVNGNKLPEYKDYFARLLTEFENVGLSININTKRANYLPNNNFIHLCGEKETNINEFGVRYTINNECFLQVNRYIKQKIYEQIIEEISGYDLAVDCYSGAGLLTALISKNVKKAIGVEIVAEAVKKANELLQINNILNVENIVGDSSKTLQQLKRELLTNKSVVVLDPPRKGCDKSLLITLNDVCPEKILYISCESSTLARDLNILCANGGKYKINFVRPYDMFPQTKHVETVVSLSRLDN